MVRHLPDPSESPIEQAFKDAHTLYQLERDYIRKVLAETGGNRSRTSEILGIDRKTLYRKIKELEGNLQSLSLAQKPKIRFEEISSLTKYVKKVQTFP